MYRNHGPVGIHEVQRGLGLSSPSVAQYHISKLLKAGLLREEGDGYVVAKVTFENMIRIRRRALPLNAGYAAFFLAALLALTTFMRPVQLYSAYLFAVIVISVAFVVTLAEAYKVMKAPV